MGWPRALLASLIAVATAIGCTGGGTAPQAAPVQPTPAQPTPSTAAADAAGATTERAADGAPVPRSAAAKALLGAWEAAQDGGEYGAYEALYAQRFTGVRRSGPRTRNFDRAGWLADRKRMFQKPMEVDFAVQSEQRLGGTVLVVGEQRFRSGDYEDRGQKRFVLQSEGGALRIAREEMLASELQAAPSIDARFVVRIPDGPSYAILGRAPDGAVHGARVAVHAAFPSVVAFEAQAKDAPAGSEPYLSGPLQLVGEGGSCSTRATGLRVVHLLYPHWGQLAQWKGDDPNLPAKPSIDALANEIAELEPAGFMAVELVQSCVDKPLVVVPGARTIAVYPRAELAGAEVKPLRGAFAALPFVRGLSADVRKEALGQLAFVRFGTGAQALVVGESMSGCSEPILHAAFDGAGRFAFGGDGGGLEHVDAVADLDGDGTPELLGRNWVGFGETYIVDVGGRERAKLSLPYFDCPC